MPVDPVPGLENFKFVTAGYKKTTWVWGQRHVTYGKQIITACDNPTVKWVTGGRNTPITIGAPAATTWRANKPVTVCRPQRQGLKPPAVYHFQLFSY